VSGLLACDVQRDTWLLCRVVVVAWCVSARVWARAYVAEERDAGHVARATVRQDCEKADILAVVSCILSAL
jgi:hypothetical protein